MNEHRKPLALATAAWIQLHGATQAYQAAVMRGAGPDELERLRSEAHDLLDVNLDQNGEVATAVRSLIGT